MSKQVRDHLATLREGLLDHLIYSEVASVEDLTRFADVFSDLADPDVMSRAWR